MVGHHLMRRMCLVPVPSYGKTETLANFHPSLPCTVGVVGTPQTSQLALTKYYKTFSAKHRNL